MYVRKGVKIDRGNHKEAIQFVGDCAQLEAGAFMRVMSVMSGETVQRSAVSYGIEFGPTCLSNGIWHARLKRFADDKHDGNYVNIYGTEKEVRSEAAAFLRGYKTDTAAKTAPETDNVKGMQRKIAAQAKEIARLKAQLVTAQLKRGNAAAAQAAQSRPPALSPASARFVSLEARIAKLEAATQPSTGPIVIDGAEADSLGLMGMKRHANATGRPVHVLGPSKHHEGRIVEPHK